MSTVVDSCARRQGLARAFADVLSYPYASPSALARACAEVASGESAEASGLLESFAAAADAAGLGELQEAYTRAFDLDTMSRIEPTCYPYVGHYLFDESHKRGAFILELRKRFRAHGFQEDGELGDHLVVLLRFLAVCGDETLADELVDDAILPALTRMLVAAPPAGGAATAGRDAYIGVLRALELSLRAGRPETADGGGDGGEVEREAEREWLRDRDSLGISRDWCGH